MQKRLSKHWTPGFDDFAQKAFYMLISWIIITCRFVNDVLQNLVMKEEPEATSSSLNFEAANQVVENEDSICFGENQFRGRMGK